MPSLGPAPRLVHGRPQQFLLKSREGKAPGSPRPKKGPGTGAEEAGQMGQPRPRGPTRVQGKCCGVGGGAFRLEGHRIGSGEDCGGDSSGASCDPGEGLSLLPPPPCPQLGSGHNCPSPVQFPGALGHDSDNDNNEDKVQGNKTLSAPTCAMPSTLSARLQL